MTQQTKLIGLKLIGFAAVVIVVGTTFGTAVFLAERAERLATSTPTPSVVPPVVPAPVIPVPPEPPAPPIEVPTSKFPPIMTAATITPTWSLPARKISLESMLQDADIPAFSENYAFWINGTVAFSGKKYSTAVFTYPCADMGCTENSAVVLLDEKTRKIILPKAGIGTSDSSTHAIASHFTPAPNLTITLPTLPKTLTLQNGSTLYQTARCAFSCAWYEFSDQFITGSFQRVATTVDGIEIKSSQPSMLYAIAPNGTAYAYSTALPGDDLGVNEANEFGRKGSTFDIQWKSGYENSNFYTSLKIGGCGFLAGTTVIDAQVVGSASNLTSVGTTATGEILLIPKNYSTHQLTMNIYDEWYPVGGDGTKPDMDGFLRTVKVPYFLWKDGLGRYIQYKMASLQPMAECGKPVVYLYPPSTTPVHVQLPSFIRVTKSEPSYPARGWDVVAQPNGSLTNSDGTVWPNLYWDGVGVNYPDARDGFVVKDGEVAAFFAEILPKYGLNAQETKDFSEFWLPYFSGAKYYRISFLTSEWSEAAPMNVSPLPDTSIRIFMDWQKLASPISITAPTIVTPQRDGFTLVEWGGEIPR